MADAGEIGSSCKRERCIRYATCTKAREDLTSASIYDSTITGSSAQTERERLARNAQLKMNWENQMETDGDRNHVWR